MKIFSMRHITPATKNAIELFLEFCKQPQTVIKAIGHFCRLIEWYRPETCPCTETLTSFLWLYIVVYLCYKDLSISRYFIVPFISSTNTNKRAGIAQSV
jgi:hypothetical protein